jgi:hypothetical protein
MVFGRVDFVGSLQKGRAAIDTDEITSHVLQASRTALEHGLDLVVGGGVSFDSEAALSTIRKVKLQRFETRKLIFDAAIVDRGQVRGALTLAAEFELLWLRNKRDNYQSMASEDAVRIRMLEERWEPTAASRTAAA